MAINLNPAHKGKLHKALGVPVGKPIPGNKLSKAAASPNPTLKKEAVFAQNAKGFDHQSGRHGGVLQKAADTGGHKKMTAEPVNSDRGAFKIK